MTGRYSPCRGWRSADSGIYAKAWLEGALDVGDDARAGAERLRLDAHLLQHAHEQIRERLVVLAVVSDMALVLKAAAGQQDRQIVASCDEALPRLLP